MFGAIFAAEGSSPEALLAVAQEFSPRVDVGSHDRDFREIVLDLHGLTRLFGDTRTIAEELRRTAADRGPTMARRHARLVRGLVASGADGIGFLQQLVP